MWKLQGFKNILKMEIVYYLHKLSTETISNYDVIGMEDLLTSKMFKNRKLGKAIGVVSWLQFRSMLEYRNGTGGWSLLC